MFKHLIIWYISIVRTIKYPHTASYKTRNKLDFFFITLQKIEIFLFVSFQFGYSNFGWVLSLIWRCLHSAKLSNISKMNFPNYPHFLFAGDTSRTEDKFSLHFIMHFTQLHCGTVINITWQFYIVLYSNVLIFDAEYCTQCTPAKWTAERNGSFQKKM